MPEGVQGGREGEPGRRQESRLGRPDGERDEPKNGSDEDDQREQEILNLKKEQFNLRFQRATGQLENTSRVRVVRRDIARLKTLVAQKRAAEL